tara:strand:- start:1835 stop:3640 length:1806 start_codon:yes stop_codon:yes gene_type:complete
MNRVGELFILLFFLGASAIWAQVSPDCIGAVPICSNTPINGGTNGYGNDDFNGAAATGCFRPGYNGTIESNSAWYHFRTSAAGQFGFNIGYDASEDWDFALYKSNDCSNLGEPVRCNFFDNTDQNSFLGIGQDPTGDTDNIQYDSWLDVAPGEDYYLLINNFSNTNSGFSIQFSGDIFDTNPYDAMDCSIINNLLGPPISTCEGDTVILDATTAGATTYNWFEDQGAGFVPIAGQNNPTLSVMLSANYRVQVVTPSNGNIISEVQVAFSRVPTAFSISDSASCTGLDIYDFTQKDPEVLGSQDPNAYVVSYYSSLADANNGTNVLPKQYPTQSGTQTIYVRVASVDNPNCFDVSEQFQLINLETPTLDFPTEAYLCGNGSVDIGYQVAPANYSFLWDTGETTPGISVSQAGNYTLTATNTQSGLSCSDSKTISVVASNPPTIANIVIEDLQRNNTVTIETGTVSDFEYQLDAGAIQQSPVFSNVDPGMHRVTVIDPYGCGAISEDIIVVGFPKYFSPNNDGRNDNWYISGVENLDSAEVFIYDRFGKLMKYIGINDINGWDGTWNGKPLPESDYWFKLNYIDSNGLPATAKYINNHFSLKR